MNPVPDRSLDATAAAFIVGDLRVDIGQQRVTRAGSDIALPNLSFRLLMALIRAAPNVLSNESLMTQVWPGLVVSPETVNKRVNLLREALGDDPREPRYIAGVRSRGYRLIAAVSPTGDTVPLPQLPTPPPEGSAHATALPVPPIPIDAHPAELPAARSRLQRWAALSVLTAGLLVAATIGIRWAARHQVCGEIPALVGPGDLVLIDRNNHKSVHQGALVLAGAIPIFLPTARNAFGMIGAVDWEAWDEAYLREQIRSNPLVKDPERHKQPRPFRLACIQLATYDGTIYNVRKVLQKIGHLCDYVLWDEAWIGYNAFHPLFEGHSPMRLEKLGPEMPGLFSTQSVHKQGAGFSQASQIHKRDEHIRGQKR